MSAADNHNGKPRYDVMRLTKRRIFARYGVFCGEGTMPVLRTWRFRRALRIPEIVEAHRRLAMQHHPDRGGSDSQMARINAAREEGFERARA
jgi:hypothetical protein